MFGRCKIGLALGGGAARGLSHIGVLEAFERYGIPIDCIAGTSMGAIIGAMYAIEPDAAAVRRRFTAFLESKAFRESRFNYMVEKDLAEANLFDRLSQFAKKSIFYTLLMTRRSFIEQAATTENFAFLIDDIPIEKTRIPFCTSTLDLISGEEHVIRQGPLQLAVAASCAIPGVFPPVELDGRLLVDGGWIDAVPVLPVRNLGADLVISVDVNSDLDPFRSPDSAFDIVARAETITRWALGTRESLKADLLLRPETGGSHWADFSLFEEAIANGREEVERHLPQLRRLIRRRRWRSWFLP
ncbi:MAG: patatin-like phospholipase family protein [Syntrophotaleaceae bacterium]